MAQVAWTSQALHDLDSVCLFVARDSPGYAEVFADRVFQSIERLTEFPYSGRVVPEIGRDDIRELIVQSYRIIYRVLQVVEVEILTIHHGRRPLNNAQF